MSNHAPNHTSLGLQNDYPRTDEGPGVFPEVSSPRKREAGKSRFDPKVDWREYPLIESREYPAYCKWAKNYRDPGFHRWTCLLQWDLLANDLLTVIATVPYWLSLGKCGEPHASRRGKYLKEWVIANGGPPARADRLSPRVFVRRMARVEVGITDSSKSPVPYSIVRRIVAWETGGFSGNSINQSHNQGQQPLRATDTEVSQE